MRLTITRQIAVLLLLTTGSTLATLSIVYRHLSQTAADGALLNMAGRQRMLSEQLGAYAYMVQMGQEEDREPLRALVDDFDKGLQVMKTGGRAMERDLPPAPAEMEEELAAVDELWQQLRPALLTVARHPVGDAEVAEAYARMRPGLSLVTQALHQVAAAFVARGTTLRQRLLGVLAGIVGFNLLVLLFGVLVIRRYVGERQQAILELRRQSAVLRVEEEHHRAITDSIRDAIIVIDQDSRIIHFANISIGTILGYSPAELLGKELTMLMPGRFRDAHRAGVRRYVETGIKHLNWQAVEVIGLHKSGKEIALEVSYGEYAKDAKRYLVGVVRDITILRQAQKELQLFRTLIDRSNDIIEVVDPATGRVLDVNERGCLDLGYSREEYLALSIADIDPTLDQSSFARTGEELRRSGALVWEGLHRRKNGSTFPVEVNISHIQLDREYAVAVVRDITERKRIDSILQEAQEQLQQAITAGRVGLWIWDPRTDHAYYSPEWKRQIGCAGDEISEDYSEWQSRLHPADLDRVLQAIQGFLAEPGPNYELEYRFRHKNDHYRHILARGSLMRGALGQPHRLLSSHVDITELKLLQQQLLQAQKMESLGLLAGGVAHDFNNLLTIIKGYSQLLAKSASLGPADAGNLKEIDQAAERAAVLVRQLLAFSRKQDTQPQVLDLNQVIESVGKMLERLLGESVELDVGLDRQIGKVQADPGQLEQMLVNLAVNARDAMPNGGKLIIRTVGVELNQRFADHHPEVEAGSYVLLSVSDTGMGMDEETQSRIFEPFFTTKELGRGTGLGLSIVYSIVRESNGHIRVDSRPGKGATFRIYLPRIEEENRSVPTAAASPAAARGGCETILVAEDDETTLRMIELILAEHGYTVLAAGSGDEVLRLAAACSGGIDLLITDVVLPGMRGYELVAQLAEQGCAAKVLYMSGHLGNGLGNQNVLDPGTNYLQKPFTPDDLARQVRRVLDAPA